MAFFLVCSVVGWSLKVTQPSRIVPVNVQLQPIITWSLVFSRASGGLLIFIVGSDWLLTTSSFYLTGQCD